MEADGGAGRQDESPTEVEEMQAEWEIFFGQEFGDVTIDPTWVNQMRKDDGSLMHPSEARYADSHPKAGQQVTPRS